MRIAAIVLAGVLLTGCEPKCLRGHVALVLVPGHYEDQGSFMQIGDIPIWMPDDVWVPAHYKDVFVCDQYQAEKP